MPPARTVSCDKQLGMQEHIGSQTDHASAGKRIPAEPDAIAVFDIAPLVFQRVVVHLV